ncbi:MAG TPA: hypothetical protein VK364_08630 [Hymenobacter sp.]|nr:hypothetical protein [Hymenobacter sp.]
MNKFIIAFEDEHDEFLEEATTKGYHLDYTLDNLPELERYMLEQGVKSIHETDEEMIHFAHCWYHLGEVVRETFGGGWAVSNNEENSINEGEWVIEGFKAIQEGIEFEPKGLARRFLRNQRPNTFRRAILSSTDPNYFAASHAHRNSLPNEE